MADPWPIVESTIGDLKVRDSDGFNVWFPTMKAARRYASLPVLIALARQVVGHNCENYVRNDIETAARAALKAAGEEIE